MTLNTYFVLANKGCCGCASGTPSVEYEENWVSLSFLAYVQLWAARKLALNSPRPWERYLPQKTEGFLTPSQVRSRAESNN